MLKTAIKFPGIFIPTEGKVMCPSCKGEGKRKNKFGSHRCFICSGEGEVVEEEAVKFEKAFEEKMKELENE